LPRLEGGNTNSCNVHQSREWRRTNCVRKRTRQPQQQPDEHTRAQPLQDATALHVHTIPTPLYPRPLCHKTTKHLASTHQYLHIHFIGPEQSETPPTRTRPNGRAASGIFHINRWRINNNMTGRPLFIQLARCCRLPAALLYSAARSNQQLCRQPTLLLMHSEGFLTSARRP
jgi:hypothetical protein